MLRHDLYRAGYREGVANRFQFALPEPRPRDGWFRIGNLDVTTTALMVIAGVASMFLYAISKETFSKLIFDPIAVRNGELWRLITWPIANPPSHIWLVLTLLFFWIIGHAVEAMVGRSRFTLLIVVITVVPATIVTLLPPADFPTIDEMGLGMLATALFVVFAAEHPNMPFFFGVPAWIVATVFVGIDVLLWVGDRVWGTLVLMVTATLLALIMVRQWGYVRRLTFIPKVGGTTSKAPKRAPVQRRGPERRPADKRGTVVEGPWSAPVPPRATPDSAAAQVELDELLDKISASGLGSLSTDEKRRLNELAKRLR
jgi:membrane associated rhomboid family serine protease